MVCSRHRVPTITASTRGNIRSINGRNWSTRRWWNTRQVTIQWLRLNRRKPLDHGRQTESRASSPTSQRRRSRLIVSQNTGGDDERMQKNKPTTKSSNLDSGSPLCRIATSRADRWSRQLKKCTSARNPLLLLVDRGVCDSLANRRWYTSKIKHT